MFLFVRQREVWPFLTGVFLICSCGLMLQIVETRLISVILWYHLAFFAISMAMLGMTAGSLLIYFRQTRFQRASIEESCLYRHRVLDLGGPVDLSLITTIAPSGIANTLLMTAVVWLKLILILLPPYVLAGMAISLALTRSPYSVGVVYGVDLLGAASGCLIVLVLLSWADAIAVLSSLPPSRLSGGMFRNREADVGRRRGAGARFPLARPSR